MSSSVQVLTDHMMTSKVKGPRWRPSAADIWTYALTFGPGILLLAVVGLQSRVPIPVLMKDPLAVVPLTQTCCHFYYGFISNLGVMLWTAAAAVCLVASLPHTPPQRGRDIPGCGRRLYRLAGAG